MQAFWKTPIQKIILRELEQNNVPVKSIRLWPEEILPHYTAGVIGILPGLRYLVISQKLLSFLNKEEVQSVVAHEAGHLQKKHLIFFAIAVLGFIELIQLILTGTTMIFPRNSIVEEIYLIIPVFLLGLLFFFVMVSDF